LRIRLTIETAGHGRRVTEDDATADTAAAMRLIREAWQKVRDADDGQRPGRRQWLGGAVAVFAALTGQDGEAVLADLGDLPVAGTEASGATVYDGTVPAFRPGRSTPPPPRAPGAQRPVDATAVSNVEQSY
jgi:hypothetical protein